MSRHPERREDRQNLTDKSSNSSWRSSFFDQVFEPRPPRARVHEWVHFNIKKLGADESDFDNIDPHWTDNDDRSEVLIKYSKVQPKSLRKDPFWVKNEGESKDQVIEFWPLQDENSNKNISNNFRSKRSNEKQVCGRTLSYESTGPHDERYYGSKTQSNVLEKKLPICSFLKVKW
jgi:hypothetical protein